MSDEIAKKWRHILWQAWHDSEDKIFARQLQFLLGPAWQSGVNWPGRPSLLEIEAAIRQGCLAHPRRAKPWRKLLKRLTNLRQNPPPIPKLVRDLQQGHWTRRFLARHILGAIGGEAIPHLVEIAQSDQSALQETSLWLLRNIKEETTRRISPQAGDTLCTDCLVSCVEHSVRGAVGKRMTFFGCRNCRQSRRLVDPSIQVVAVLDSGWEPLRARVDGTLWVNVLRATPLIEFDGVKLLQATDQQIESFAMQIRNDTDSIRQAHYQRAVCTVGAGLQLSENSRRLLSATFGRVDA